MSSLRSRVTIASIGVISILLATSWFAGMRFAGEIAAQDARYHTVRWESGKARHGPGEVAAAKAQLQTALNFDAGNSVLYSDLARLEDWSVQSMPLGDPLAQVSRQTALEGFRRAARLSPTSGYHWVGVAQTRYQLGAVDIEFGYAMEQTLRWAPWQPELQLSGIQLGLATWQILDEPRRRLIAGAIERLANWKLADSRPALVGLLNAYDRRELGCPWAGNVLGCPGS